MRARCLLHVMAVVACGLTLSGCETFDIEGMFSNKKPLPGERRTVFPGGVPGVQQGVPPELVRGYQPPAEPAPQVVEEKPKPKPQPQRVATPKPASQPAPRPAQQQVEPQQQQQQQQPSQAAWPASPPRPAAQQQPAAAGWPSPPPQAASQPSAGNVWPDPPRTTTR